jgi:hypothetical protein
MVINGAEALAKSVSGFATAVLRVRSSALRPSADFHVFALHVDINIGLLIDWEIEEGGCDDQFF